MRYHNAEERENAIVENELMPILRLAAGGIVPAGGRLVAEKRLPEHYIPLGDSDATRLKNIATLAAAKRRARSHTFMADAPLFTALVLESGIWPEAAGLEIRHTDRHGTNYWLKAMENEHGFRFGPKVEQH